MLATHPVQVNALNQRSPVLRLGSSTGLVEPKPYSTVILSLTLMVRARPAFVKAGGGSMTLRLSHQKEATWRLKRFARCCVVYAEASSASRTPWTNSVTCLTRTWVTQRSTIIAHCATDCRK